MSKQTVLLLLLLLLLLLVSTAQRTAHAHLTLSQAPHNVVSSTPCTSSGKPAHASIVTAHCNTDVSCRHVTACDAGQRKLHNALHAYNRKHGIERRDLPSVQASLL